MRSRARSLLLQVMLFMEGYLETVKQAEEAEGVRTLRVHLSVTAPFRALTASYPGGDLGQAQHTVTRTLPRVF